MSATTRLIRFGAFALDSFAVVLKIRLPARQTVLQFFNFAFDSFQLRSASQPAPLLPDHPCLVRDRPVDPSAGGEARAAAHRPAQTRHRRRGSLSSES